MSAYLEGTGEKNAEVRFYKSLGRRPVEKFKSIQVADLNKLTPEKVFENFINSLN